MRAGVHHQKTAPGNEHNQGLQPANQKGRENLLAGRRFNYSPSHPIALYGIAHRLENNSERRGLFSGTRWRAPQPEGERLRCVSHAKTHKLPAMAGAPK